MPLLFKILYKECKHMNLWLNMSFGSSGFVVATIVLHQWFPFDACHLIGHDGSLDDLLQPPLQLQLWERWTYHRTLSQGLGSTGPHSNYFVPCWMIFQHILSTLLHLFYFLWRDRFLGSFCTFVYFCRTIIHSMTCKLDSCYLVWTILTLFKVLVQASHWSNL